MHVESTHGDDLSPKQLSTLEDFCKKAEAEGAENWRFSDWRNQPHSLLYCLLQEGRFAHPRGNFYLLFDGADLVSVSGIYASDFSPEVAIGGVRAYTLKNSRLDEAKTFYHGDHIFPRQLAWAVEHGFGAMLLTFNADNIRLVEFLRRIKAGKAVLFGLKVSPGAREFYSGFELYPEKILIKNTPQFVMYKILDDSFELKLPKVLGDSYA